MSLDQFVTMYLDYVNNFLTVERFAEHYAISVKQAEEIVSMGYKISHMDLQHVIY